MAIIAVKITEDMIDRSKTRDNGQMNAKSFMKGRGNMPGFLGEEMVMALRPDFRLIDSWDYDLEYVSRNGRVDTIDVKTKEQNVPSIPDDSWQSAVTKNSLHQVCDVYVFCRVYYDKGLGTWPFGWILGWIRKKEYLTKGREFIVGEEEGDNGYTTNADCICLPYGELNEFNLKVGVTPKKYMKSTLDKIRERRSRKQ